MEEESLNREKNRGWAHRILSQTGKSPNRAMRLPGLHRHHERTLEQAARDSYILPRDSYILPSLAVGNCDSLSTLMKLNIYWPYIHPQFQSPIF